MADSIYRRAGARIQRTLVVDTDPAAVPGAVVAYAKEVLGVTQAFLRSSDGVISQLTPTACVVHLTNAELGDLVAGMPVAFFGGGARKGLASSQSRSTVVGLVAADTAATLLTPILTLGPLILTTLQWDAVTGGAGGLMPGLVYYLDTLEGMLTLAPPAATGDSVTVVGQAMSATQMLVDPRPPVLL